ncbi:Isochorismatase-like protein [Colletotrichum lupini]|nr:Isochorismatase-like protein [Colletotrichum lupini]
MALLSFCSLLLLISAVSSFARADAVPFERLSQNDSVLLIVDHQVGLFNLARDFDGQLFYRNVIAHAALGKLYDLPVIITTSQEEGPNGPLPREILDMYPDVPVIKRPGEINAWDNAEFRDAVKATGRNQMIVAGIVTDVCVTFLSLSLREEGYSVWANVEASGTTSELIRDISNSRMQAAGVHLAGLFSIAADLFKDWRGPPGVAKMSDWYTQYAPAYLLNAQLFNAAIGTAVGDGTR